MGARVLHNEVTIMIKLSVLYPYRAGESFDLAYYCERHMPMVQQKLGGACLGASVEHGISGAGPNSEPTYVAMGHLLFESMESFLESFPTHEAEIMRDVPNYTSVTPIVQISDVKLK